jgi:amino acid adenylation domain-containing protein
MNLLQRISTFSPEKKKLLESLTKHKDMDFFTIPITRVPKRKDEYFPLSFEQEPIWVVQHLEPGDTTYDVIGAVSLQGNLNKHALENSINEIIKRHEILRTLFNTGKEHPVQVILPSLTLRLQSIDLRHLPREEKERILENIRDDQSLRSFDPVQGPLMAAFLFRLEEAGYLFVIMMHHLISDLVSLKIFFKEMAWFYEASLNGKTTSSPLPDLACQYVDYAFWQRRWFRESPWGSETRKKHEQFWLEQFRVEPPVLNLPADYPRPAVKSHEAAQVFFTLEGETVKALKQLVLNHKTTLYAVFLTQLYIFLAKISGQDDIVVGTPVSSRKHKAVNDIIGLFTRTMALRNYPQGHKIFHHFLSEVNTLTLKAFNHQEFRYDELVNKIRITRDASRNPLFEVMFNFLYLDPEEVKMPGLTLQPFRCKSRRTPFDIELTAEETRGELFFKLTYSTRLFKSDTIDRFIAYLRKLIETVNKNPELSISQIEILPEAEKRKILRDFNRTEKDLARDKNYTLLWQEQVKKKPLEIAAVHKDCHITYKKLAEEADGLATRLYRCGVGSNDFVALVLQRSITMLTAILGVFKAGAAYLPIEIEDPPHRIEFILKNSECKAALMESRDTDIISGMIPDLLPEGKILFLDQDREDERLEPGKAPGKEPVASSPHQLAYLIYTSGTTGKPKGVMIHQLGMLNHLYAKIHDLSIGSDDNIAQTASACFDISVWQFLAALLVGGTTRVIDKTVLLDPLACWETLQRLQITILEFVPSLMVAFLEAAAQAGDNTPKSLKYLKWMVSTGEPLTPQLVNHWYRHYPGITLVNAYGPTEVSDDITHYMVPVSFTEAPATVPIGKPLQNLQIYILDKNLSLCPVGVRGEICVAGLGVGKGYWKDSEKTNAAFIPNPFAAETEKRDYGVLYKTGDLGYFRPDGNIECLGRLDSQVKIRGNRIELGEIENQLAGHKEIKEAVVLVRTSPQNHRPGGEGDRYLCAYLVQNREIPVPELKEFLLTKLPDYMIPSCFVPLEKLPLTANGKIDRKTLPEPVFENSQEYIAPGNENEARLLEIWSEILGLEKEKISVTANFFQLGGHSLHAAVMISKIHQVFRVKIPLVQIFKTPSLRDFSGYIARERSTRSQNRDEDLPVFETSLREEGKQFRIKDTLP